MTTETESGTPTLHLARWTVTSGSQVQSRGAVVIASGDHQWEASAEGNGAVDALFRAVDRALAGFDAIVVKSHHHSTVMDVLALKVKTGISHARLRPTLRRRRASGLAQRLPQRDVAERDPRRHHEWRGEREV